MVSSHTKIGRTAVCSGRAHITHGSISLKLVPFSSWTTYKIVSILLQRCSQRSTQSSKYSARAHSKRAIVLQNLETTCCIYKFNFFSAVAWTRWGRSSCASWDTPRRPRRICSEAAHVSKFGQKPAMQQMNNPSFTRFNGFAWQLLYPYLLRTDTRWKRK